MHSDVLHKINSTPLKTPSIAHVTDDNNNIESPAVKKYLKVEFRDKLIRGIPVEEFVRSVWGVNSDDVALGIHSPDFKYVRAYHRATGELKSYSPLAECLTDFVSKLFPDDSLRPVKSNLVVMGNHAVRGQYATFKPDIVWSTIRGVEKQKWDWLLIYAELKNPVQQEKVKKADHDDQEVRRFCVIPLIH